MTGNCPLERMIEAALKRNDIAFTRDQEKTKCLDFYLLYHDVYIEIKQFHSPRISEQSSRVENLIVIQGRKAAYHFVKMLDGK